ncbi:MAG: class A beta-lactamase-related serine hydrolase [Anaerolineales bacterium]|nr:class A beta-lactamase-related serine hydrolase [Anaerolineales bacterium]
MPPYFVKLATHEFSTGKIAYLIYWNPISTTSMKHDLRVGNRRRKGLAAARISIFFFVSATAVTAFNYFIFATVGSPLPSGVSFAQIPVAKLHSTHAISYIEALYSTPVTLHYAESTFQIDPKDVDFTVNGKAMLQQLNLPTLPIRFWNTLNSRTSSQSHQNIPLKATYSQHKLRAFLENVSQRYDRPPFSPWADPERLVTVVSPPGWILNVEDSIPVVEAALFRPNKRSATLVPASQASPEPDISILDTQLHNYIKLRNFDGLLSMYFVHLNTNTVLHRNWMHAEALPTGPGIAFSGMSIIKITLLAEFYRQVTENALPYELDLVSKAVTESSNWTSNILINWIGDLDSSRGIQRLNQSYELLGMHSTFIGGLYDTEDPPGFRHTPANTRKDINTRPDPYMQTTVADIGRLLQGIYLCAQNRSGLLTDIFELQFTPNECADMLDWLSNNRIGVLLEAGVPEGTRVAHKHGWGDGEPIGDAGVIYSPGGDYVLVYYLWSPDYTYWDENSLLLADVSKAVYYFVNPITP